MSDSASSAAKGRSGLVEPHDTCGRFAGHTGADVRISIGLGSMTATALVRLTGSVGHVEDDAFRRQRRVGRPLPRPANPRVSFSSPASRTVRPAVGQARNQYYSTREVF